ncbi:hypothetical protein D3C78_1761110 [compost metagenome]
MLSGQHAQGITHENIGAVTTQFVIGARNQALVKHVKGCYGEIGLSLASPCGEPDQVDDFPVVTTPVNQPGDTHQQKSRLESAPVADMLFL